MTPRPRIKLMDVSGGRAVWIVSTPPRTVVSMLEVNRRGEALDFCLARNLAEGRLQPSAS